MSACANGEPAGGVVLDRGWCSRRVRLRRGCANHLPAHKGLDDEHRAAAVPAQEARLGSASAGVGVGSLRVYRRGVVEYLACPHEVRLANSVGEQPVLADAMKNCAAGTAQ